eukprot:gb/GECG01006308.1/.p1 GENE.gb/GECG01006308.1/~~gb/GECG01006308.1/.p1  ORF type:complete len:855 (+),score=77.34 gb/GECG01006308.1/:1-2565(+)
MQRVISAIFCSQETETRDALTTGSSSAPSTLYTLSSTPTVPSSVSWNRPYGVSTTHTTAGGGDNRQSKAFEELKVDTFQTSSGFSIGEGYGDNSAEGGVLSPIAESPVRDSSSSAAAAEEEESVTSSDARVQRPRSQSVPTASGQHSKGSLSPQSSFHGSATGEKFPSERHQKKFIDQIDQLADFLVKTIGYRSSPDTSAVQRARSRIARSDKIQILLYLLKLGLRNALSAYAIKLATALISALVKGKGLKELLQSLIDRSHVQFGLFVGCCCGFTAALRVVSILLRGKDGRLSAIVAGLIGGLAIFLDPQSKSQSFPLYLLVRACYAGLHTMMRKGYIGHAKSLPYWMYAFASGCIGYAFLLEPQILDKSYSKWFRDLAGMEKPVYEWIIKQPYWGIADNMVSGLYLLASAVGTSDPSWVDGYLPDSWREGRSIPGACCGPLSKKGLYIESPTTNTWSAGLGQDRLEDMPPAFRQYIEKSAAEAHTTPEEILKEKSSTLLRRSFHTARKLFNKETCGVISDPLSSAEAEGSPGDPALIKGGIPLFPNPTYNSQKLESKAGQTASLLSAYRLTSTIGATRKTHYLQGLLNECRQWWRSLGHGSQEYAELANQFIDAIDSSFVETPSKSEVHPEQPSEIPRALSSVDPASLFPGVSIGDQYFRPCEHIWHEGTSCLGHHITAMPRQFLIGLRVYLPVQLLPQLLFRYQSLLRDPVKSLHRIARNTAGSCLFLVGHSFMMTTTFCLLRTILHRDTWYSAAASCASGVAGLYFEAPKRVTELTLYAFPRGLEILFELGEKYALVARIPHGNVLMFCIANALFIGIPREDFKPTYRSILNFFYGDNEFFQTLEEEASE